MAPIGSVIKNGLIFIILTAGITFLTVQLFLAEALYFSALAADETVLGNTSTASDYLNSAARNLFFGLLILLAGVGIVLHKTLSDTIEDGMYEF